MRKLFALLPAIALAVAAPAFAQISSQDSRGNTIKTCARDRGDGVLVPCFTPASPNGAEKATAANPDIIALPANAATEATLAAIRVLLGASPAQDATLQAIKTLLGAPAQDTSVQALKAAMGAPAQDATLAAIRTLLGAAPAQDATLQAIKTLLGAPAQDASVQALKTTMGAPAQDATLMAIRTLLGAAPAQDATLQAIKTLLASPALASNAATATGQASQLAAQQAIATATGAVANTVTTPGAPASALHGIQGAPGGLPVTTATADTFTPAASKAATAGIYWDFPVGSGQATLAPTITGLTAAAGTLTATVSDDRGATYYPVRFLGTAVLPGATTITADGIYSFAVGGHTNLRLTVTTAGTGNVGVAANASTAVREVSLAGAGTSATNPVFNNPTALAPNASTDATLAKVVTNTKPASSFAAAAVGATLTPGIGLMAVCPSGTSGSTVLQGADGSQISMPLAAGPTPFPFAVAKVVSQTNATCTFTSLF